MDEFGAYQKLLKMIEAGEDISKITLEKLEELHIPYLHITDRDFEHGLISGEYIDISDPKCSFEFKNAYIDLPHNDVLAVVQDDICTFFIDK